MMMGKNNPMFGKTSENHPSFGKTRSEEARAKMSAFSIGNSLPPARKKSTSRDASATKIEVNYLELGGGSASPLKLLIVLLRQQLET
jgi:hypothetical protein